jgi:SAM-dependent methyltransferase
VNLWHRWYCGYGRWAASVERSLLPWALEGIQLGADLLEVGPGPGVTTELFRQRAPKVTAVELDAALAARLARRLAGSGVWVVRGDGAAMPFRDGSFDSAAIFTMLHHVPSRALQDRLLAEVCRCLRPGGLLVGADSLLSLRFRVYHLFDTMVPVDPDGLPSRLEAAGFSQATVDTRDGRLRFRARRRA